MPIFSVKHVTSYRYARPVRFGEHRLLFRPRDSYDQRLLDSSLTVDPEPAEVRWIHDVFGNCVAVVRFSQLSKELKFDCRIQLEHTPQHAPDFQIDTAALKYPFVYDADESADLAATMKRHYPDDQDEVGKWARQFVGGRPSDADRQSADDALLCNTRKLRVLAPNGDGHPAATRHSSAAARHLPRFRALHDGSGPLSWFRSALRDRLCICP